MNDMHIRRAAQADAAAIAAHSLAMAQETEGKRLDPDRLLAGTRRLMDQAEHGFYLVAERGGELIGQLMITHEWSDWRDGEFWWVQSVYVQPAHRRQGVFRALFDKLVEEAKTQEQVCGLRLYADRSNRSAHAVYRALGMAEAHYLMFEQDWS